MHRISRRLAFLAALFLTPGAACSAAPDARYTWRNVVVGGGGFAPNIIYSPVEKGLAYLRTDMGGAYRWDEKQQRWIPLQDGFAESSYFGIESLAPDPKDPNKVYVAAGMYSRDAAAILRSSDRGATWQVTPVPFKMGGNENGRGMGERLAVDPNRTSTLLFGSRHDGLWRSDDSGKSWRKVESFPWKGLGAPRDWHSHGGISFVVFDPKSRNVFAAIADPTAQHLFRSSDGGQTWSPVPGGPPANLLPAKAAIDGEGVLYVDYCDGIGPNGISRGAIWKLDTKSGRWTDITPDPASDGGYMGLTLDRTHPGRLAVSTVDRWHRDTVWVSDNAGRSWTSLREKSVLDVSATPFLKFGKPEADFGHWMSGLAFDPFDGASLTHTTGATVMRTRQSSAPRPLWQPWVKGIEQTAVITLMSPAGGAPLITGFGDISGFVHERLDASPTVQLVNPTLPNTNNLDFAGAAPNMLVRSGSIQSHEPQEATLAWSEDGGRSWHALKAPPAQVEGEAEQRFDTTGDAPITVGADGAVFVVSSPVALATNDRGKSWWRPIGLPKDARITADKADPNLWYAVDYDAGKIFVSRDGARTFSAVATAGLPKKFERVGRTDREAQPALLATPGTRGEIWFLTGYRLYRSADAGNSFTHASPDDIGIELFGLGKSAPGASAPALYAAAERRGVPGIYRSLDGGKSWARINDDAHQWGLRFRAVTGNPRVFGRVYIATDGRGILYGDPLQ